MESQNIWLITCATGGLGQALPEKVLASGGEVIAISYSLGRVDALEEHESGLHL